MVQPRPLYRQQRRKPVRAATADLSNVLVDGRELILLFALLAGYLMASITFSADEHYSANVIGPLGLMSIMLLGAWWHLQRQPLAIWQPIFWFRVAVAAYYGMGNLAPYIANDTTMLFIRAMYDFSEDEAFKVGMINVACSLCVLGTAWMIPAPSPAVSATAPPLKSNQSARGATTMLFAAAFLIAGGLVRYFVVLPSTLGLIDTIPGLIMPLAKSYIVGLFLLILVALRGNRTAMAFAAVLVPLDLAIGLLTFAKTEVLLTLIFCYLAFLHHRLTLQRILIGIVLIVGVYSQLDPVIHYGRNEIYRRYAERGAPLRVRLEILEAYTGDLGADAELSERQSFLSRLSYTNAASMVTTWHDIGRPGDSLKNAFIVLIPRAIWPEKPEITAIGKELYLAASSDEGSSISPGLFAESYWNFGWAGIPLLMPVYGLFLVLLSRSALRAMKVENWLYLPAVLLGIQIGARVDGWYVSDVIGAGGTALVLILAVHGLERFFSMQR